MNKKGKEGALMTIVLIIVGVVGVSLLTGWNPFAAGGTKDSQGNTVVKVEDASCGISDTTLSLTAMDLYSPLTSVAGSKHRLYTETDGQMADKGNVSNGGTTTVSPKDKLLVYYGRDTEFEPSPAKSTGTIWYTIRKTYEPSKSSTDSRCRGSFDAAVSLVKNSTPTFSYTNDQGSANTAQTIGTAGSAQVEFALKAPANAAWGNTLMPECANKNVVCVRYNSTVYSTMEITGVGSQATVPKTINDLNIGSAANTTFGCYNVKPIANSDKSTYNINLKAATGQNPDATNSLELYGQDCDLTVNADTGAEIFGVQDEQGNDIGASLIDLGTIVIG